MHLMAITHTPREIAHTMVTPSNASRKGTWGLRKSSRAGTAKAIETANARIVETAAATQEAALRIDSFTFLAERKK